MIPTPSSVPPDSRPVVILDAPGRAAEIHGSAPHALGRPVVHAGERDADAVLALDPAVILLSSEWTHEWRLIAAAARRVGVPVVYVMDGVIEWSYLWNNLSFIRPWGTMLQPLIASDLCVIGRHPARILSSLGLADRIHVVGLPRFDALPRERVLRAGTRPRLLVATARTAGHDVEQQVMTRRALRDLKAWLDTQPQIEPVWRIAADLAEDIGVAADIGGGFSEVLSGCAALLSFTSTCVLEAMHKRVPVAIIDYRAVPLYVTAAWEIRCAEHIPGVIQELLYPPSQKLAWQDACLADELEEGGATAALVSVLRAAIERPRAAPDETTSPAPDRPDGRLDFRQVHSELSAFSLGSLPVLQYELSAAHHLLRHTRHEKGFLQRDALELSEAFCGGDIRQTRVFSLLDQLPGAGLEGSASVEHVAIGGRAVRALVTPAPARLTYAIPCGLPGRLSLAVSLHPRCWDRSDSGPCRLIISADETTLLDATLDLRDAPEDRKWWWFDLAVPSAHGAHTLVLQALGVDGDAARDAVWRAPLFHWHETEDAPDANAGFRPRLATGADFYVPGRTVA